MSDVKFKIDKSRDAYIQYGYVLRERGQTSISSNVHSLLLPNWTNQMICSNNIFIDIKTVNSWVLSSNRSRNNRIEINMYHMLSLIHI